MKRTKYFKLQEQIARRFGSSPTQATILAIIKTSLEPISLDEIVSQTNYSLATISNAVKIFEMHGLIIKSKQPGSKKVFVQARKDYLDLMTKKLLMIEQNTSTLVKELPQIISESKDALEIKQRKDELRQAKISNKILSDTIKRLKEFEK